jgi:hypothetical protein
MTIVKRDATAHEKEARTSLPGLQYWQGTFMWICHSFLQLIAVIGNNEPLVTLFHKDIGPRGLRLFLFAIE